MSLSSDSNEINDSIFKESYILYKLSELSNIELSAIFEKSLSNESFELNLGIEPDGYAQILFNEVLRRAGRLPYSKELNFYIYNDLLEFTVEDIIQSVGEEKLEKLIMFMLDENDKKEEIEAIIFEMVKNFSNNDEVIEKYHEVKNALIRKYEKEKSVIKSFIAHMINKAINNSFPPAVITL
ncbi:hypothetical protein IOK49_02505 [Fervidicoccus fontis]|jgi:hypothetical protein|uniref:Uncharacterized protein n=2 Tax=Fervidicoccus fontis TaxID=683846 RepID=H9ZZP2_FERFK|nr:hypothetical protein [Fervidicoccus fontis]AFH42199.1 hypothetical protein FFONT_0208 [Fervidicoccus fontis Kam940]MBE9390951.1 hypothetical protein [Fervidicoccus fontis]PMB76026.1 MAG: 2-succinyl-5-enolpyruvyl-6-hydroxy-3-cyclohexene-1-carboxylic-acid synthase [Fervidicoccus fontis]HEW64302.1 hypothetical protein [Fervidicoccus fontis]